MATVLERLTGRIAGAGFMDYMTAFASGAIDAMLLKAPSGGLWFLLKNVAIPLVDIYLKLPKGFVYHSTGQLGLILTLILTKGG